MLHDLISPRLPDLWNVVQRPQGSLRGWKTLIGLRMVLVRRVIECFPQLADVVRNMTPFNCGKDPRSDTTRPGARARFTIWPFGEQSLFIAEE